MFINDMFNRKNITESDNLKSGDKVEVTTVKGKTHQGTFDRKNDNGSIVYRTTSHEPNVHSSKDKGTEKTHVNVITKKHLKSIKKLDEIDYSDNKFKQMMGNVAQQKTLQQHIEDLENVLNDLKWVEKDVQKITTQIKYDRLPSEIMLQVEEVLKPFRPYIDDIDYQDAFNAVKEAQNKLESAVYGFDNLIKYAEHRINNQIMNIQDEIDYPDDEDDQLGEGLYPGEYYTYLVKFDDGTTEKLNFSSDDIDWDRVGAKRNKKVVNVKRQGGIQGEPYAAPSKPHQWPDDRGLARAQRAYDRQEPKESVAEDTDQRWLIKIWDGNSNREIERKGSYEQVRNSLVGLPHSHIVSIEPIEQKGVEEGYQDDNKEREENLRYDRSRNPVAADIRKKLNPNREFSEREIQQWASKSPENKEIYDEYQKINYLAKKAWAEKDGAAYTGLQNKRYYLRKLIGERMFGQEGVTEGKMHISPSGVKTNMDPSDDDYEINYGKNGAVAKFRKANNLDVKTGEKKVKEAANPAQQAAIAISMKKAGKKPKVTNEDIENYVESMQRHGYESVEEQKCPECGGVAYSDKMIAEEKDACYHKVKSRYKIWPSAYASGALVKCRKAGAKNWGNKSKK